MFGESSTKPTPVDAAQRFDHYELVVGDDGKPVELGRGAMGVTYKAFDVNLRCPVTLKVISDRYLGDESAGLRFLREARAAANVRQPNVSSVFHLGRTGDSYFYAMEFVEGETLEKLIKRWGQLEIKLALEIASQVAAGLAAIHEQKLVHRDIKPTNIMVRVKEEGSVATKIIDLGLAKTLDESASEAGISLPGTFAGTPEFASPEQFAGVGVDIRSDLYSLGVTLWVMVAGQTPFRISRPRDNTRCAVFKSGVREACSLRSKSWTRQPSFVFAMRQYSSGMLARSLPAMQPWQKRFHSEGAQGYPRLSRSTMLGSGYLLL